MPKRGGRHQDDAGGSRSFVVPVISACRRRREAERADVGRHVVHAAVGDHEGAGDALGRHVGEPGAERMGGFGLAFSPLVPDAVIWAAPRCRGR